MAIRWQTFAPLAFQHTENPIRWAIIGALFALVASAVWRSFGTEEVWERRLARFWTVAIAVGIFLALYYEWPR